MITKDYGKFKENTLQPQTFRHRASLESSIIETGGNIQQATVDKDMMILDGHGRLAVCRKHNLPFSYHITDYIGDNATIIQTLNTTSSNWRIQEWVEHHSITNVEFNKLKNIVAETKVPYEFFASHYGISSSNIKKGIIHSLNQDEILEDIKVFMQMLQITEIKDKNQLHRALGRIYKLKGYDSNRLIEKASNFWTTVNPTPIGGSLFVLQKICEIYDYKSTKRNKGKLYARLMMEE